MTDRVLVSAELDYPIDRSVFRPQNTMNVSFFTFEEVTWSQHIAAELELAEQHLSRGDEVRFFTCNADLPTCRTSMLHLPHVCFRCVSLRKALIQTLSRPVESSTFVRLTPADRARLRAIPKRFASIEELQQFMSGTFEAGPAVIASLWDILLCAEPDVVAHAELIYDTLFSGVLAYLSATNILQDERPDLVYVMNGRWAWTRGVFRACKELKIKCRLHERGSTAEKYAVFYDHLPQDLYYFIEQVRETWEAADPVIRTHTAEAYFRRRAAGDSCNWKSFITGQKPGLLPQNWSTTRRNLGLFTTSSFEWTDCPGRQWKVFQNQLEGIVFISDCIAQLGPDYHLYVRIHPNQVTNIQEVAELLRLQRDNVTIILPDSPVSTYSLIENVETVITFGSTVGVEATFWRKPSVLLCTGDYQDLDVSYEPNSHSDLKDLLVASLVPKPLEGALMYGYYMATFGRPFRRYARLAASENNDQLFIELHLGWLSRLALKLSSLFRGWGMLGRLHRRRIIARATRHPLPVVSSGSGSR